MLKNVFTLTTASVLSASVFAADVRISGDQKWVYHDNDGATETELDGDFNVKASTETEPGLSIRADININEGGGNDGGSSLRIGGGFGKIDMGDTSSAMDAIDDVTDWGEERTEGVPSTDHAIRWTLPSIGGLNINASWAGDENQDGNSGGTSVSATYKIAGARLGYAMLDNDDDTEETLTNVRLKIAGVGLGYELHTATDAESVDTDTKAFGLTYSIGDAMLGYENVTVESAGTTSEDITAFGIHYDVAPELTAFVEYSTDDLDAGAETTSVGVEYSF